MILVIAIIALVVAIVVLAIKYFMAYAKLTSHKSFRTEARRRGQELKYENPMITCDYCGARIDTSKDRTCPSCGGEYSHDKEWIEKHRIKDEWIEANAEEVADQEIGKAQQEAEKIASRLKLAIIILLVILGLLVGVAVLFNVLGVTSNYTKSEKLNSYSYDNYEPADYAIESGTVVDTEWGRVSVTGIYEDKDTGNVKIEYELENLTDKPLRFRFDRVGQDGYVGAEYGSFHYELVKRNSKVTIYDSIDKPANPINTILFNEIELSDKDGNSYYSLSDFVYVKTNAPEPAVPRLDTYSLEFLNGGIRIQIASDDDGRSVRIENNTDYNFTITSEDARVDGKKADCSSIYQEVLPAHSLYDSGFITAYDEDSYEQIEDDDKLEITLNFKCLSNPELSFTTSFFEV